ncbi:MAG TPA: hypothetical protein V6D08_04085 [Candidatus Obscuribacterales bacterium]
MSVLILAPQSDEHARAVLERLAGMAVPATCWAARDLLAHSRLDFRLDNAGAACLLSGQLDQSSPSLPGESLDLFGFRSVWLRRPGRVRAQPMPERWMESFVEWESSRALDAIFRMIPALWVNSPAAEHEARLKLRQLETAKACGLSVPDTLVTNDPRAAAEFFERMDRSVVYKLIDEGSHRYFPDYEVVKGIPTMPLREADLEHLQQVATSLHLFQRRIKKRSDIRVTVVGHEVFAVEIMSQEGRGDLDFRLDYSVPMHYYELPPAVEESCLTLVRRFGLNYAAIDLGLTPEGEHVFFEINPAGQWLWMELRLELPISQAMARLLAGSAEPLTR